MWHPWQYIDNPKQEIENTLKGRKIPMDSNQIATIVDDLNDLLNTAQRVQEEAGVKADDITVIKEGLEESNSKLEEAVSALEDIASTIDEVEGLLSDAEEHDLT